MELHRALLSRRHLSVISAEPDHELDRMARTITPSVRAMGRADLEALFGRLLAARDGAQTIAPKTLDLLGHSTARTSQLRLGDWVVDAADPAVAGLFRGLANHDVLPRLGIHAVRLLGCKTAATDQGRATICALADILGVEVYGTNHLLYDVHHDKEGFREIWEFLLVCASDLRRMTAEPTVVPETARWPRTLDIDALPAVPRGPRAAGWPRRIATASAVRRILPLIRGDAGAPMSGVLAVPRCELLLPSATPGMYHVAHVLFDGAFVRFFPDGAAAPGVAYPVDDVDALLRIVDELPAQGVSP